MKKKREHIVIVGSGVAGLSVAYLLSTKSEKFEITLCDSNPYFGGHTNTITINTGPDQGLPIDTGFIVCNEKNYPLFLKILSQLNVSIENSDMSFGFHSRVKNLTYTSDVFNGLFTQRKNIISPRFYHFIYEILRFNKIATHYFLSRKLKNETLGDFINEHRFSDFFVSSYLLPMGAAIWSSPCDDMNAFPAQSFFQFWHNHCLLQVQDRPQWKTVSGGAKTYVDAILSQLNKHRTINTRVKKISRHPSETIVHTESNGSISCDKVVIATHANQALSLLEKPTENEKKYLGAWTYSNNNTFLHTDNTLLPDKKRSWASWNVLENDDHASKKPVFVTYYMNRLQNLKTKHDYFVSLNPTQAIDDKKIIKEIKYTHPCFNQQALDSQAHLPSLNGQQNSYFCGSYFGYGFHEDAVRSSVQVCEQLGVSL